MPRTVFVRAREGVSVPMEGAPRRHITSALPVEVALTPYYRRQIAAGDLIEAAAPAARGTE